MSETHVMVKIEDWQDQQTLRETLERRVKVLERRLEEATPKTDEEKADRASRLIANGLGELPDYALDAIVDEDEDGIAIIVDMATQVRRSRERRQEFIENIERLQAQM